MELLLDGTELGGRETVVLGGVGSHDVLAVRIDPAELVQAWEATRSLSGVRAVAVTCWMENGAWVDAMRNEDITMRHPFGGATPAEVLQDADGVNVDEVVRVLLEQERDLAPSLDEDELSYTLEDCAHEIGSAPTVGDVRDFVAASDLPPSVAAERAVLEHVLRAGACERLDASGHMEWFEPEGQPTAMLLLPVSSSVDALAYVHWYGAEERSQDAIAVMRRWEERYGATLVAHWGTMLQFTVERPPTTLEEAWSLALEQMLLAPCTTLLPGVALWRHAAELVGRRTWFVHERP